MIALIDLPLDGSLPAGLPGIEFRCIGPSEISRAMDPALLRGGEVLFCFHPPANFDELHDLRWIQLASAGYSQLLPFDLPGRGIRATNARGTMDVPIAEWNLAMMVNLARDLRQMIRNQDAAVWDRAAVFQNEIRGKTVGIWGYGGIGRETARLAKAFGLRVHVLSRGTVGPADGLYIVPGTGDPRGTLPDRVFGYRETAEFLGGLDFLVLAMPLTPSTTGIVGRVELSALPRHAFVLNPARGPLIVEEALLDALRAGTIAGAALDTHYHYPLPPDHPLWSLPNVILTPHISGSSLGPRFLPRVWDVFRTNLQRYVSGGALLNELTASQLWGK